MRTTIFLIILSLSINGLAQDYNFGKVSKEELQETINPLDSSASATYLYKYRKTYFQYAHNEGFKLITDIHNRVKIYNQEGFDYATTQIMLLINNDGFRDNISGLKASTYNLVNDKIEETKLLKDAIYNLKSNENVDITKFTMPNIKEGSVIEFKYRIISPFFSKVDEFVFQYDIPIKKLYAEFEAPEYFSYKMNGKGYLSITPKAETKNDKITYTGRVRESGGINSSNVVRFKSSDVNYVTHINKYNLSNIPALKEEPYVYNLNNYRSTVKYELSYIKQPQSLLKSYATSWEDVVKTIYESTNFGGELDKSGYFEDEIDDLISTISDPKARTFLVYDYVKSKVRWNGYIGKFCDQGVKNAFNNQVGNVAEINLMLTSMLRYAGLKANPVLVSTRQNGVPLFPTINGYNYVVSIVELPKGPILLDASNKYGAPNVLPLRTLNWEGRIVREDKSSSTVNLYPNVRSEIKDMIMLNLSNQGDIEGAKRSMKTIYNAMVYRKDYLESDKTKFLEDFQNKFINMEISDFEVKNSLDFSKPIIESFKFHLERQADVVSDKMYFSPLFFSRINENPFKLEKRELPIDLGFPTLTSHNLTISLPKGYKVETIPEPMAMILPDNLGYFKYNISVKNNIVQVNVDSGINSSIIPAIYYEDLKAYFSRIIAKEAEQIVLTKI